jgi:dCMP deaminase
MLHNHGKMQERPSWDTYFMEIAHLVATRATCPRRSVGAVLVKDRRILATGYNGAPRGISHCPDEGGTTDWPKGCLKAGHCIRALHAEQNALLSAAMIGTPCAGSTIYVTCQPCNMCAKMLINAGIERVIYEGDYPDEFSLELFRESGMELYRYVDKGLVAVEL